MSTDPLGRPPPRRHAARLAAHGRHDAPPERSGDDLEPCSQGALAAQSGVGASLHASAQSGAASEQETEVTGSRPELARLALPLGFLAASFFFAAALIRPDAARETALLAFAGAIALAAVSTLDREPFLLTAGAALAATTCIWAVPPSDARSAALSALLVASVALALGLRIAGPGRGSRSEVAVAGAAVALQALVHPHYLLVPTLDAALVLDLVALPLISALGLARLARRCGPGIWLAAPMAILDGGVTPAFALIVAAATAVEALPEDRGASLRWWLAALLAVAAKPDAGALWGAAAAIAVGLALRPQRARLLLASIPLVALGISILDRGAPGIGGLVVTIVLLPAALAPERRRIVPALLAALLALLTDPLLGSATAALSAGLLLGPAVTVERWPGRVQLAWSVFVAAGGVAAASYPWVREAPLATVLSWLSLSVDLTAAGVVAFSTWALAILCLTLRMDPRHAPVVTATTLLLALGLTVDSSVSGLTQPVVLSPATPVQEIVAGRSGSAVIVHSFLANSIMLPPGTPVATITLTGEDGVVAREITLGTDTGEWAARRPSLVDQVSAPPAWLSWPAADGPYFGQRYRLRWPLGGAPHIDEIQIDRAADLPPDTLLTVMQVALER